MFVTKSIAQLADVNGQPEAVIERLAADKPSSCSVSSSRRIGGAMQAGQPPAGPVSRRRRIYLTILITINPA